ncbi:sugar transferase [Lapidilactobacillus concavus DSM 17758]|uniref:Sugar transferase n=1 Tax=Lapidilactobacillus concavus DSM 17758 TaxID=1423735 RepID=A0A0R1VPL4_9LACO|nr:NAD-dependent epimerase/dehydratase family protein [Lapidilactobacillus concavus]KRM07774.1 sugar transferase [Lapidilactobacillus concavus DSM 17758]GEL13705.1 UDP-glucose 4-epimerase [Lapidilactobacillus concavus]
MKRVLITGKNSYIGESFRKYVEANHREEIQIDVISVRGNAWKSRDFSVYDTVFHVAGKAHADVSHVSEAVKQEYYAVNRDLAVAVAQKYRSERNGFSQFIYMSSIIVYGQKIDHIVAETPTNPANFYGDSKLQAERSLQKMTDVNFQVLIIRPPMIYGPNSKGNFPSLVKIAKISPVFPKITNQRSMLFVDNLAEFISQLIIKSQLTATYFPQNKEYVNTTDLVKMIRTIRGNNVILVSGMNSLLHLLMNHDNSMIGAYANKAFGSLVYDKGLSKSSDMLLNDYQVVSFKESIRRSL